MQPDVVRLHAELEVEHWWFRARREIVLALLESVGGYPEKRFVVDIGCGTGANAAFLSKTFSCAGVDPNADAIRVAVERYPEVSFACGRAPEDISDWTRRATDFLFMDVLEHVSDDENLLSQVVELAPAGARFLMTVPANPRLWSDHDVAHGHYRRYVKSDLEDLAERLSLEVRLLSYMNARLYPVIWAMRKVGRFIGRTLGPSSTDLHLPPSPLNELLFRIFRGEAGRLSRALSHRDISGYRAGLSLILLGMKQPPSSGDDLTNQA